MRYEGPVRKPTPRHLMQTSPVRAAYDPLGVQLPVHLASGWWRRTRLRVPPCLAVSRVAGMTTLAARPMTGRQRHRLIKEEEPCEPSGEPLLVPPAPKAQRADDPQIAGMKADDPLSVVQPPAVARERSAQRKRLDVSQRCHTILSRHGAIMHPIALQQSICRLQVDQFTIRADLGILALGTRVTPKPG